MMKKCLLPLLAIAALLFMASCLTEPEVINSVTNPPPVFGATTAPPAAQDTETDDNTPATAVSAFFGYLAAGNVRAADALLTYSNGGFANMAEDMYRQMGTFIFHGITYRGLEYSINGSRATASFTMVNNNFNQAAYEVGFALGYAGLIDPDDPNLEEILMSQVGEMILAGDAPVFEMDFTVQLRQAGGNWRIVDNDITFALAVLGSIN